MKNVLLLCMSTVKKDIKKSKYSCENMDDYVFLNRVGRPYKTSNVDKKFRYIRQCVMAKYPSDSIENVTPYYLRHTFTTNGITAGVSIKSMQELLGHATTRTLTETYLHSAHEEKIKSIHLIEENSNNSLSNICVTNTCSNKTTSELENKWCKVKQYKTIESGLKGA